MRDTMIVLFTNIILIAWPLLFFLIWHLFGYRFIKKSIIMNTLFYVDREELWAKMKGNILFLIGIPMTVANGLVYSIMYYNTNGLIHMGDKILVIYLFLFGMGINILYMSLMVCKHCFTREKTAGYKFFQVLRTAIIVLQFILLDGYILILDRLTQNMSLTNQMGKYGLIGFIFELLLLFIILAGSFFFVKAAKKFFFARNFPR